MMLIILLSFLVTGMSLLEQCLFRLQEEEALFPLGAGNRASVLLSVFTLQLGTGQLGLQRHWPRGCDLTDVFRAAAEGDY